MRQALRPVPSPLGQAAFRLWTDRLGRRERTPLPAGTGALKEGSYFEFLHVLPGHVRQKGLSTNSARFCLTKSGRVWGPGIFVLNHPTWEIVMRAAGLLPFSCERCSLGAIVQNDCGSTPSPSCSWVTPRS